MQQTQITVFQAIPYKTLRAKSTKTLAFRHKIRDFAVVQGERATTRAERTRSGTKCGCGWVITASAARREAPCVASR